LACMKIGVVTTIIVPFVAICRGAAIAKSSEFPPICLWAAPGGSNAAPLGCQPNEVKLTSIAF
jgi:hypothetical protein